jgi:hypothetical protein
MAPSEWIVRRRPEGNARSVYRQGGAMMTKCGQRTVTGASPVRRNGDTPRKDTARHGRLKSARPSVRGPVADRG